MERRGKVQFALSVVLKPYPPTFTGFCRKTGVRAFIAM